MSGLIRDFRNWVLHDFLWPPPCFQGGLYVDNHDKGDQQDKLSFGRYGLQAALVGSQIYIFAGKKNYKECVNDLVFLETKTPSRPVNLRLMKETSQHSFNILLEFKIRKLG